MYRVIQIIKYSLLILILSYILWGNIKNININNKEENMKVWCWNPRIDVIFHGYLHVEHHGIYRTVNNFVKKK